LIHQLSLRFAKLNRAAAYSRMVGLQRPGDLEFAQQHIAVIEETAGTVKALAETLAVP